MELAVETMARAGAEASERRELQISGMRCANCSARVEQALLAVPGVLRASVNLVSGAASVEAIGGALRPVELIAAARAAGYEAELRTLDAAGERRLREARVRRYRRQTASMLASIVLSTPLLLPMLSGWSLPGFVQLALASPVQFVLGAPFYRGAWRALKARTANMDVLVVLGTSTAYFYSLARLVGGAGGRGLDFGAGAVVISLILIGKWLEERAKRATGFAIEALLALRPARACVLRGTEEILLPVEAVRPGDLVLVRPGETVPVDGEVLEGESTVDESLLTGESRPVAKQAGGTVIAGSGNGAGLLQVRTSRTGTDTVLARIIRLVEGAEAGRAPVQSRVDRVAGWFVPVVIGVAAASFLGWWALAGAFHAGLMAAIAVLVVSCPCALGLATPTALMVGLGAAARAGILIRDPEALEQARAMTVLVVDKTGTLTEGRPAVTEILAAAMAEAPLLALAARAEAGSEHPLARAVRGAAGAGAGLPEAFQAHVGLGVTARLEGRAIAIGNRALMARHGVAGAALEERARALEAAGRTVMWVAWLEPAPELLGAIAVSDPIRATAAAAMARLRTLGIETVMLTGDEEASARAVAAALGISQVIASARPERKLEAVRALQRAGNIVGMLGDGVNDAPALAAAEIGIAMGGGADAAMKTAGITVMRADPRLVGDAIAVSRATDRTIRQGLAWAFLYNAIAMPLAAIGALSPMVSGAAMALSSIAVTLNALRLRRWRPLEEGAPYLAQALRSRAATSRSL